MLSKGPHLTSPLFRFARNDGRGAKHSPRLSETPIIFGVFESDEQRYKADVVGMQMSKEMLHRSLSVIATATANNVKQEQEARRGRRRVRPTMLKLQKCCRRSYK